MNDYAINEHGQVVFPLSVAPHLRCGGLERWDDFFGVVRREYEERAVAPDAIPWKAESGGYPSRYELLVDVARALYWADRFWSPLFTKLPTRWADVPLTRPDVYLPDLVPWTGRDRTATLVRAAYERLPSQLPPELEDAAFRLLFDLFENMAYDPAAVVGVPKTASEVAHAPEASTLVLTSYDPAFPVFTWSDIRDFTADPPEATALMRWAMVAHNQHPWDRADTRLKRVADLGDDDLVVLMRPRDDEVSAFLARANAEAPVARRPGRRATAASTTRRRTTEAAPHRAALATQARIAALAVSRGEHACSNADIARNAAVGWSPMSPDDIVAKTGIVERRYSLRPLHDLALDTAERALGHSGVNPDDIGGVVVCTATNGRQMPSLAAWITGQLSIGSCRAAYDVVAACAGFPYGMAAATRLLQESPSAVLVVWADKFSDKLGTVRSSRMIFADGAAAAVVVPASSADEASVDVVQTYAGGPCQEVDAVMWPDARFGMSVTVNGDGARSIVSRYLRAMVDELRAMPDPADPGRTMLDAVDLVVPHQANEAMLVPLAESVGVDRQRLYFNIAHVGNTAAASIPIAIHDAVADGLVRRDTRLFAPGFGAGATAGYVVLRVDPTAVVPDPLYTGTRQADRHPRALAGAK